MSDAVVAAARALRKLEREFDALPWQDRSAVAVQFVEEVLPLRAELDAALEAAAKPFSKGDRAVVVEDVQLEGGSVLRAGQRGVLSAVTDGAVGFDWVDVEGRHSVALAAHKVREVGVGPGALNRRPSEPGLPVPPESA